LAKQPSTRRRRSRATNLSARRDKSVSTSRSDLKAAQVNVGAFLRSTRQSQRLTQAEVAGRTRDSPWQLSRAAVSAIERGKNFPGLEAMLALSSVLHIDPKELIERARMSVVPVDVTGLSHDELEARASRYFWAGQFHKALAVYDAIVERMMLEDAGDSREAAARLARVEVRRATTLKRAGALLSAIASAERALFLSRHDRSIQAEVYVVLADLQVQRGHLPLADDAARRAIELSAHSGLAVQSWAWMVQGRTRFLAEEFEEAKEAFLQARRCALEGADEQHLAHIEGNIGSCWIAQGELEQGRAALERAVELAKKRGQPHLEASWAVELGKIAITEDRLDDARKLAQTALRIARPREHSLTVFRAEWLLHRLNLRIKPGAPDRRRLTRLHELFLELDQHEGIEEIQEYKAVVLRRTQDGG
jgi:transcriptional regulator with XRE-family HTH domain